METIKDEPYSPADLEAPEWEDFLNRIYQKTVKWTKEDKKPNLQNYLAEFRNYRVDITFAALNLLARQNRIERVDHILAGWNGNHHYFVRGV